MRQKAADTYQKTNTCDALDGLQRSIHLQHLDDRDDALGNPSVDPTERIAAHAASKGHERENLSTAMGC